MTDRTHDSQNRLTEVGTLAKSHTANGELTSLPGLSAQYDAWGRTKRANNIVINVEYEYDALNRRIVRDYDDGHGGGDVRHDYHSAQWQVIEEREDGTASADTATQYVWSPVYVDAMILRDTDANSDGDTTDAGDERTYVQHDANFNVTAIADDDGSGGGTVLERYIYDPYGNATALDANWSPDADGISDHTWQHLHQGGRLDAITGLHHFRNRDYDASLMRWTRQDPLGYVDGSNTFELLESSPIVYLDPFGTTSWQLPTPFDDGAGSSVQGPSTRPAVPAAGAQGGRYPLDRSNPQNEFECQRRKDKIDNIRKDIERRVNDIDDNPLNLPDFVPGGKLRESVDGHWQLLNRQIKNLEQEIADYTKRCGSDPSPWVQPFPKADHPCESDEDATWEFPVPVIPPLVDLSKNPRVQRITPGSGSGPVGPGPRMDSGGPRGRAIRPQVVPQFFYRPRHFVRPSQFIH